jgi:hypothetical protein
MLEIHQSITPNSMEKSHILFELWRQGENNFRVYDRYLTSLCLCGRGKSMNQLKTIHKPIRKFNNNNEANMILTMIKERFNKT